ncbi:MAG: glucokinase [Anaerolineae bacterium]|nr:glucokinase [Anaerolineae bacterium]MDW8071687.1 glucokinase [Anaerolineae bacterium]
MLLVGDIGGTKTTLAIIAPDAGVRHPLAQATFASQAYASLTQLASEFLRQAEYRVDSACFGVAGPVVAGRASVTNLPWEIEAAELSHSLGIPTVQLINDLQAIATAIPHLEAADIHTLNPGRPVARAAIAVIAPGTGLGEGFLTWDGTRGRYQAQPSEGGHASFAPSNALEDGLLRYLRERYGHVSYERVCSGIGMRNIYEYLKVSGQAEEPSWLAERLASAEDPNPIIVEMALDATQPCPLCTLTIDTFVSILGNEAGNLALKVLATGGVYLAGGIPPRILPALEKGFFQAFRDKGRFAALLSQVPVHVVINPQVALLGAACHGLGL